MEKDELLAVLGIEGVETLDQFKEKFNKSFVNRTYAIDDDEIKSKVTGKLTGKLSTLFKQEFGLENKDIEGKKVEEIFELGLSKQKSKIAELEVNMSKNTDEKLTEWQTKFEKTKKEATEYKSQLDILSGSLEETKKGFEKEKKGWVINAQYGDTYKKVQSQFADEVVSDALKVEGFNSVISKKYIFDLDESTNTLAVYDREGNRVENPNKIGAFLTPEELLLKEATENKMLKMNEGKKTIVQQLQEKPKSTTTQSNNGEVKLHPRLR